jgi:Holliday junction DNA helicase RuvA
MITHLEGVLVEKSPAHAVIDCGGVGYFLNISLNTFSKLPENGRTKLYTEQLYVRDDMPRSFGFADIAERNLFRQLISVSGVGGTSALLMLSSLGVEIHEAIATGDIARIKSVKGIGQKTAERVIVDLRGKFLKEVVPSEIFSGPHNKVREEALSALVMLGFAKAVAEKAVDKALKEKGNAAPVEDIIKTALNNL